MSSPSDRVVIDDATPGDAGELREILESRPMPGDVSLVYSRRPDAYASLQREGEPVGIVVIRHHARVIAMGVYAIRTLHVNGVPERVAYLFGLRARGDALKVHPVIHRGYARIGERLRTLGVRRAVTTIVASNARVAAMLRTRRACMPAYESLGAYDVFALLPRGRATAARRGANASRRTRAASAADARRIAEFLSAQGRRHQFFPSVEAQDLRVGRGVPDLGCVRWLEGRPGEVLAVAALWDQTEYRQYRVHGYSRRLGWVRRLARHAPFLGLPRLPDPGEELRYATLALWAARDDDPDLLGDLLDGLAPAMQAYPFVLAGSHAEHPLHPVFRRHRHVAYRSEVFAVSWDPAPPPLDGRPLYLECGTL